MKHIAAKLVLSGLAILMAIAPVPFEKWAWQRIAFGIIGLGGVAVTKTGIDKESEEQRLADIYDYEQKQYEKELAQVERTLAIEAAQRQEAVRFGLQTQMINADYQGAFVALMEEKHPYYLDALQAQQQAAIESQKGAYSTDVQNDGRAIESESQIVDPQLLEVQKNNPEVKFYDFDEGLRDDAVGIIVAGNSGSGKTSVGNWLAAKLTESNPAQVFALDPHFNDTWTENGIHALGEFAEIEEALGLLLEELDARRTRKKNSQHLGDPIICFLDELNACLLNFANPEKCEFALKRLGSEGRKFDIILIALNQSSNCDDLGISKPYRSNYFIILTGQSATTLTERWKQDDPRTKWILAQAYPCAVTGSINAQVALHPTHNSYKKYKKKGNPPLNMGVVNQLPLTFLPPHLSPAKDLHSFGKVEDTQAKDVSSTTSIKSQKEQLDATFNKTYNPLDHFIQEASQEQLEEILKSWRELADTAQSDVSDTKIQKNVSDTYQKPESAQDKGLRRIWDVSDFRRNLPDRQEEVMFRELDTFFQNVSRSPARVIKEAWGFSNGNVYSAIGKPCFVYLVTKYGTEEHKTSPKFAKHISEYLASADDANDE